MKTVMSSSGTSKHNTPNGYNRYVRAAKRSERAQSLDDAWRIARAAENADLEARLAAAVNKAIAEGTFGRWAA